ncbi:Rgg/GadR/MutR family transcriptional regulator, partial [Streptococcus pneumoniae]
MYNHIINKKQAFYFLQKWKRNIMENFGAVLK